MNLNISHTLTVKLFFYILFYLFCYLGNAKVKVKFFRIEANPPLSNSRVSCVFQDSKGFLWVGTEDGLNRFDGYQFKVYRNIPDNLNSLLKNTIINIYEDTDGIIWVSTGSGGLHYYNRKRDDFTRISAYSFDCEVSLITEDKEKNLWIAGVKSRFAFAAKLNKSTGEWKNFKIMPTTSPILSFIQASSNEFWLGIRNVGFYKWNELGNTLDSYLPGKNKANSIVSEYFHCAIKDTKGNIWISTKMGLSKLDVQKGVFTNYTDSSLHIKERLLVNNIWVLCLDGDYIWISNENGGLSRLNTKTNEFSHFQFDKNDAHSVVDNSIWAIYKDRQNRIWIGTYSKGLCVLDKLKEKFSELDIPLENDVVNAIWEDSRKRFWVGTEQGLAVRDHKNTTYYKHTIHKNSLTSNPVLSIFEDTRQQMWIGTWAGGLNKFDEKSKSFTTYLPNENLKTSLSDANVFAIKELSSTHQILAGTYKGLNLLTDETKATFEIYKEPKFEFNNYIRTIYEDSQNNVWIGTLEELTMFDRITKKIIRFNSEKSKTEGIHNYIVEDSKGQLWIGTNKGLWLYSLANKKLKAHYTTTDGLPSNVVNGILEDDNGNLWLSTNEGVSKFNPESKTFKNYDANDGLLSNEFKPGVCFKNEDGQFFFGGKGVNLFYPDSIKENPHIPPVYIMNLKLFNQSAKAEEKDSILNLQISEEHEISLPYQYNFFTINYVALNFTSTNKNKYAYKLEGMNRDWIQIGNHREATFTNVDPGTYTFRVKACNNDGLWNEKGASLIIHILPPWWQTWWFRLLVFISIGASIFIIFKIKLAREKLKNELKLQSYELEHKNHDLITYTMRLAEERLFVNEIIESAHSIKNKLESKEILSIIKKRKFSNIDWEEFTMHFESANPAFFKKILEITPTLTPNELKLCALLRLNLSSKEISAILRVQPESVIKARYRIRKKLNIESEDNLVGYLMNM